MENSPNALKRFWQGGSKVQDAKAEIERLELKKQGREEKGKTLKRSDLRKLDQYKGTLRNHSVRNVALMLLLTVPTSLGVVQILDGGDNAEGSDSVGISEPAGLSDLPPIDLAGVEKVPSTPITPFQFDGDSGLEKMLEMQEYWKEISLDALEHFREADPEVGEIIEFMKENAFYTIPRGPVVTSFIAKDAKEAMGNHRKPHSFEVVFMPDRFAQGMASSIITENGGKTIRIAASFRSREWLGLMLAHEISHVMNQLVRGENSKNQSEYIEGEAIAHLLEMKLLRHWSPEAYETLIQKGTPLLRANDRQFFELATKLYPLSEYEVSRNEHGLGLASVVIAVRFEEALQNGATTMELGQLWQEMRKNYHRNLGGYTSQS